MSTPRPFPDSRFLSGGSVEELRDWLKENADPTILLGGEYQVGDLLKDLGEILGGMWSDGIDAMGEDA